MAGLLPPGDDDTRDGRLMDSIKMAPVSPLVPQIDPSVKLYNHVVQSRSIGEVVQSCCTITEKAPTT